MITRSNSTDTIVEQTDPLHTVVGQNLKGESKLVVLKSRVTTREGESLEKAEVRVIQSKEEQLWKESHPGKELFITVCNLCKARHLLDFNAEESHFECTCETGPPDKEHPKYYICNAQHPHFDVRKSFNKTQEDCKICKKVLSAKTKKEAEFDLQVRKKQNEELEANAKLRKAVEDGKIEAKVEKKKLEAELFARVLAKELLPLFNGLKKEIRNVEKKTAI